MMQQFGLIPISNKQVQTYFGKSDAIVMPDKQVETCLKLCSEYYEHLEQIETCNKPIKLVNLFQLVQVQESIYRAILDSF